jgi:hypothetical protein
MPNIKISDLPPITLPAVGDESFFEVQTVEAGQDVSRKISLDEIVSTTGLDASFLTVSANAQLPNERVLTAGTDISLVDTGPNGTLTINATAAGVSFPLLAPDGTAGAPSYSWSTAPTTGIHLIASNLMGFSILGTTNWEMGGLFQAANNAGPAISNTAVSGTVPGLLPAQQDPNTGIGSNTLDQLSLIAGGAEIARATAAFNANQFAIIQSGSTSVPELTSLADPDTGFRWTGGNQLTFIGSGSRAWHFTSARFFSEFSQGPALLNVTADNDVPTVLADQSDADTGIGSSGNDEMSLIAGGVESIRIDETAGAIQVIVDPGLTNTSDATPPLAFGGGTVGFRSPDSDQIFVILSGAEQWGFTTTNFRASIANGPALQFVAPSGTVPSLLPNKGDTDTGIGQSAADEVSLIGGGVEAVRFAELSSQIIQTNSNHVGLTASVTQTQAGGLALLSSYNEIATVANSGDALTAFGVKEGDRLVVVNNGVESLQLFPAVGDNIGGGVDAAISIDSGDTAVFIGRDATNWDTLQNSSVSGGAFAGLGTWRYRTEITSPPADGQIRFNNADPTLATELFMAETNVGGTDVGNFLNLLTAGSLLYIQNRSDGDNFFVVEISTNVDSGTFRTFGIANIILEGPEPSNNTQMAIVAVESGAGGGGGDVFKVGTPVDNQVGVWTGDGTIEGTTNFTFDDSAKTFGFGGGATIFSGASTYSFQDGNLSLDGESTIIPVLSIIQGGINNQALSLTPTAMVFNHDAGGLVFNISGNLARWEFETALRVTNAAGTDWIEQDHDGTDYNFAANLTTDINFTGLTGRIMQDAETLAFLSEITGDVAKVGTPVDNQVGVWTGDGTIEGTTGLTYDGSALAVTGNITVTGTVDGIDIATDVAANTAKVTNATHTGQVTGATALSLAVAAITDQPAAGALIGADTFLVNDGGVLSEITATQMATFFGGGIPGTVTNSMLRFDGADFIEETQVQVTAAGVFSVLDASLADSISISHNGAAGTIASVGSTALNFTGVATQYSFDNNVVVAGDITVAGGNRLIVLDAVATDSVVIDHDGTDGNIVSTLTADLNFTGVSVGYKFDESIYITEKTTANADFAGLGQFWVRDDVPNTPMFTDDAGTDFVLNTGTANDVVQARRTTGFILTTAFVDVTLDTTDVESDAAVLDHDLVTNTDNIIIGVTGTYKVSYEVDIEVDTLGESTITADGRVRVNDGGVGLPGSDALCGAFSDGSIIADFMQNHLSQSFYVELTSGDFITLQLEKVEIGGTDTYTATRVLFTAERCL